MIKYSTFAAGYKESTEGDSILSPSFLKILPVESLQQQLELLTGDLLQNEPDYFLVEIKIKPTNNIKVFVDADKGISIDKLASVNRQLHKKIVAAGLFPLDDFSLEVSSPGLDQPLKLLRQYQKNIGRKVEVLESDGKQHTGILTAVNQENIILEKQEGKQKETKQIMIPFNQIKNTKVCIVF